jgi:hypothetical protein
VRPEDVCALDHPGAQTPEEDLLLFDRGDRLFRSCSRLVPWCSRLFRSCSRLAPWCSSLVPWCSSLVPWCSSLVPWCSSLFPRLQLALDAVAGDDRRPADERDLLVVGEVPVAGEGVAERIFAMLLSGDGLEKPAEALAVAIEQASTSARSMVSARDAAAV